MSKAGKHVLGVGAAGFVLVAGAIMVGRFRNDGPVKAAPPSPGQAQAVHDMPGPGHITTRGTVPKAPLAEISIFPLPANAAFVPDENLLQLSALVDLPNAANRNIDKSPWPQAVAVAEVLAQGPCDCEQRNWLNHFIEMGNDAISGADDAYYKLADLMVKMARNDKQLSRDPVQVLR